jgi:hypothetical protein
LTASVKWPTQKNGHSGPWKNCPSSNRPKDAGKILDGNYKSIGRGTIIIKPNINDQC